MQLGWIDFSRQDKADAINIINSMKEKGVLDELGFGALRQAFANCFFPGTSTIQTRAKYFFIVPYILQDFISSVRASENDFQKFIADSQNKISGNGRNIKLSIFAMKRLMSRFECYHIKHRSVIESNRGTLKNNFHLEYHKARSIVGMFRHFFYSIVAYMIYRSPDFYQNFFRLRLI